MAWEGKRGAGKIGSDKNITPQEESVQELYRLLDEQFPAWKTEIVGDLDDPENIRTTASVLDSMLHAHGDPPYINLMSKEDLSKTIASRWRGEPTASYMPGQWFNPLSYLLPYSLGGGTSGNINAATLHHVISEISHDIQDKDPDWQKSVTQYNWLPYLTGSQYETEGTLEHEAHSLIEPLLYDLLLKQRTEWEDEGGKYRKTSRAHWLDLFNTPLIKDGKTRTKRLPVAASSTHDVGKLY